MIITGSEKGDNMKNKKIVNIFECMLVCATILSVAGMTMAKTTTPQSSGSASDPAIEWIHTFDSIINDRAYYVDQTADGGYIFTGSTIVTPPGYTELFLVKTSGNGEESWHKNFQIDMTN